MERLEDYEGAVEALQQAAPQLDKEDDPRIFLCQRFNLAQNLSQTGRLAEAMPMLPGVREQATRLGNALDLVRVRWLEGRIESKLGQAQESIQSFRWVRDEFIARGIAYDAALVTLEAAVVVADLGHPMEIKRFGREAAPVFTARSIDREILATLEPFRDAAESGRLTGTLSRQLYFALQKRGAPA